MSAKAKADSNVEGMNLWRRAVDGHENTPGMPRYPALHLAVHCEVSGMWAGSLFSAVGGSVYALVRRRPFGATVGRAVRWGGPLGFLTGAGMLYGKYLKADELSPARVDDRAFRLRANRGVVAEDTAAVAGAVVGGVAGLLTAPAGAGRLSRAATAAFGTVALAVAGTKAYFGYEKYNAPKGTVAPGPKAFQALPKKADGKDKAPAAAAKSDKPAAAPAAAPAPAAAAKPVAAPAAAAEKPKHAPAAAPAAAAAPAPAKPAAEAAAPKAAVAPAKAVAAEAPAKH